MSKNLVLSAQEFENKFSSSFVLYINTSLSSVSKKWVNTQSAPFCYNHYICKSILVGFNLNKKQRGSILLILPRDIKKYNLSLFYERKIKFFFFSFFFDVEFAFTSQPTHSSIKFFFFQFSSFLYLFKT